jgi:2,4-dienoyl-CoA reductase-like NADH-dependent reductase (Old Yellow Enzyme family)
MTFANSPAFAAGATASASIPASQPLDPLFAPLAVRGLTLRNRFVMPAMQRGFMDDGAPTRKMVDYLRRCAAGGVGLVICESTSPDHPSAYWQPVMGRLDAGTLHAWQEVIDAVHAEGAAIFIQLWHPGSMRKVATGHPLANFPAWSPSGLIQEGRGNGCAMTRDNLAELQASYARAARDAQRLGADGVELHAAHGYLMDQFLWAETNQRTDEYGGATLAQRARYPAAVAAAMRDAVGPQLVLSLRFSQFKEVDYGATIARDPEDLRAMITLLRSAGVDMFNVSSRRFRKPEWPDSAHPDWSIAEWTRSFTDAVVMTTGSVGLNVEMFADLFDGQDPSELSIRSDLQELAARVARGTLDLVGVGRMHIANNDFVNKVRSGRMDELALFNKHTHLAALAAAIEEGEPGFVEQGRKNAAAD